MYRSPSSQNPSVVLQVEALEERCLPSTAEYVTGLYNGILHRSPAPAEVAGWVDTLNKGASPSEVALAFTRSVEYETHLIQADYTTFLGRQPAAAEVAGWLQQLQAGVGEKQLEASFLASNEFFDLQGSSALLWLHGVYEDVLGRAPDPAGLNLWSQGLQAGSSRAAVALAIVDSWEADSRLVSAAYWDLLQRHPDPSGLASWIAKLQQGLPPSDLVASIASSAEFIGLTAHGTLDAPLACPAPVADPVPVPLPVEAIVDPLLGGPSLGDVVVTSDPGVDNGCGCNPGSDGGGFDPGFDTSDSSGGSDGVVSDGGDDGSNADTEWP